MNPLKSMGTWRATEGALEISAPMGVVGFVWFVAYTFLSTPTPGSPLTTLEVTVLLGALTAVTAWMASRQVFMMGRKFPWNIVLISWVYVGGVVGSVAYMSDGSFASQCTALGGALVESRPIMGVDSFDITAAGPRVCLKGGVPDNPYLPGVVLRPSWSGSLHPVQIALFALISMFSAMGLRDRRLVPSKMARNVYDLLRLAPGKGAKSASGKQKVKDGQVVACANATLWGELCGQMYSADKVFRPGESCIRCHQSFKNSTRTLNFRVVTLFSGEIDTLNGLEKVDTVGWPQGEPMPPDARISGEERWVELGRIAVPDVISVVQLLSLVHDQVPKWAGSASKRVKYPATIAKKRASRISAWIWFGALSHRLTFARPTTRALLALGPARLRDLVPDGGEELWLQLDIGFLPLEIRSGFTKTYADGRSPARENSKVDVWVPISSLKGTKADKGVWVPRVEGNAFRLWLSVDRLRRERADGLSEPLPYSRHRAEEELDPKIPRPSEGSFDFVRMDLEDDGAEPSMVVAPGASIAEWDWMEPEQIQLLRQQCVVLVGGRKAEG